jgi:hypothetical protein
MAKSFKSKKNNRTNKISKKRLAYGGGRYLRISRKVYHKCEFGDKCPGSQAKVYLVWVENHDTILDIKNKLREEYHFSDRTAQTFILLLDKQIMEDNEIIGEHHYDLKLEFDLTKKTPLPLRPLNPLDTKFRFRLLDGQKYEIPMSKDATVEELRIKIAEKLNLHPQGFRIGCKGKQISDDEMLLKDTIINLMTDDEYKILDTRSQYNEIATVLPRLYGS